MGKNAQLDVPEWRVMYYSGEATGEGGGGRGAGAYVAPSPTNSLNVNQMDKGKLVPPHEKAKPPVYPTPWKNSTYTTG